MSRQHYVSRFHFSAFCDPASTDTPDPWLWIGSTTDQSVRRRSPNNVATVPGLFDGPGGLSEPGASLETFLAHNVEGPAATALRRLQKSTSIEQLPPEVMRYLAWAASRSLPMQRLAADWATRYRPTLNGPIAEAPPPALAAIQPRHRSIRLIHSVLGEHRELSSAAADELLDNGWIPDPTEQSNFLEGVHIQAYYFQVRWFPRLRWFTLRPPTGQHFIIGDDPSVGAYLTASTHRLAACATKRHFSLLRFHGAWPRWPEQLDSVDGHPLTSQRTACGVVARLDRRSDGRRRCRCTSRS